MDVQELGEGLARLDEKMDQTRAEIRGVREEVRLLKEHQVAQNGAVNELKLEAAFFKGREEERSKWEERQAASIKWLFTIGLAAAGVLSGIVFGVIDRLTQ